MYKICKTDKSLARQRELENGFLEHLETDSYFKTDISKICRQLNIPRKTFYRYFDSKEDILNALIDHRLLDMDLYITKPEPPGPHTLRQDVFSFFSFWQREQRFLDTLSRNYLLGQLTRRACSREHFDSQDELYLDRVKYSSDLYVHYFLMSGIMTLMLQWHTDGYQKSVEEMAELVETLYSTPLKTLLRYEN